MFTYVHVSESVPCVYGFPPSLPPSFSLFLPPFFPPSPLPAYDANIDDQLGKITIYGATPPPPPCPVCEGVSRLSTWECEDTS